MTPRVVASVALVLLAGLAGCGPTLVAMRSYRGHRALDADSLATLAEIAERGGSHKADVLARLGPPTGLVGQASGEVFIYRYVARDAREVTLNPGYLVPSAPSVPLWADRGVSGRDDVLMVFFDADGQLVGASMRHSIDVDDSAEALE